MRFFVVLGDGRKFGPADVPTLNQWIKENRLTPDSILEEELSGAQQPALELRELDFGSAPPPPSAPKPRSLAPNPFDPLSQMDQPSAPQPSSQAPKTESKYANPPSAVTNYPRGGPGSIEALPTGQFRGGFNLGAFVLTWIWGLNHKAYWTLLVFLLFPLGLLFNSIMGSTAIGVMLPIHLVVRVALALYGNTVAWNSGRFTTIEDFKSCQRAWAFWGLFLLLIYILFIVLAIVLPIAAQIERGT